MILTDTHCHLYADQFDEDRDAMIQRAISQSVTRMFLPNIDKDSIDGMIALALQYPKNCFPMMGLHPCSVGEDIEQQLAIAKEWLFEKGETKFYAVGEIGLDYYWDVTYKEQQIEAFKQQIEWAKELALPIVVHCRDSFDDIIKVLKELKDERLKGILHCFTGTLEEAQQAIDLGFYLGIGGVVTFKNSGLDKVVAELDLKHLVLETDAPYLTPTPHRGKRNESSYVNLVVNRIAEVKRIDVNEVAKVTTENSQKIFEN